MTHCEECGAEMVSRYKNRRYCSTRCRTRRHRALKREAAEKVVKLEAQQQRAQLGAMLEQMAKIAPATARSVKSFVDANGIDCGFSAVKLCLAFHQETRMLA